MDNNDIIFYKDLGNRLMIEFEDILNLYEALLAESKEDCRTFGEESRASGERKYALLKQINERTEPLKQDFAFFAGQIGFPTGKMEWNPPFDDFFENIDIEIDSMVMDSFFYLIAEAIYKDLLKQASNTKEMFLGNYSKYFYACPCCGNFLFIENGDYSICGICKWENDKIQNSNPNYEGGANKECLNAYRNLFRSRRTRL